MIPAVDHVWTRYKNTSTHWVGTDSQQQFEINCAESERKIQLETLGLDSPSAVTYTFNSHGFRCNEFDSSAGIVTLGCSQTAGVGLPVEKTWPIIVSENLNLSCWNLSVGGGTMDTCMRLLYHYIDYLNIKFVLILRPMSSRLEIFWDQRVMTLLPGKIDIPVFQKIWYSNDINSEMNNIKNTLAIQHLCLTKNIPCIIKDIETDLLLKDKRPTKFAGARDMQHAGQAEHQHCAQQFLKSIKTDLANL